MSAAVMPMRRVPWEKAGIAVAATRLRPATATRKRLNMRGSTVRRPPRGARADVMQAPSQACARPADGAACGLHDPQWEGSAMTDAKAPPTIEEFRARAAMTGLTLTAEDI